jgi:hypothetical protein
MFEVPGYHRQIMGQCGGGDLFVNSVFWMRYSQSTPHLRFIVREIENMVFEAMGPTFISILSRQNHHSLA